MPFPLTAVKMAYVSDFTLELKASWSNSALDRLGKQIARDEPFDTKLFEDFRFWMINYYQDVKLVLAEEAEALVGTRKRVWSPRQIQGTYEVAGRVKTLSTLRDKLRRPGSNLSRIRDIAGTRIDFDGGVTVQDSLAMRLKRRMEVAGASEVKIIDRREQPAAGYRAVHLEVRSPRGYLEIQLRTRVQSEWANTYETFGDIAGRGVRYGEAVALTPEMKTLKESLQRLSESWAGAEVQYDKARSSMMDWSEAVGKATVEERLDIVSDSSEQLIKNLRFIQSDFPATRVWIIERLRTIRIKLEALRKESK